MPEDLGGPAGHRGPDHWVHHVADGRVPERELCCRHPPRGRLPHLRRVVGELRGPEVSAGSSQAAGEDQGPTEEDEILCVFLHLSLEDRSLLLLNASLPPPHRTSHRAVVQ